MSELIDLPRLYEAIRIVSVIVISISAFLILIWFFRWTTCKRASWWRPLLGIGFLILGLWIRLSLSVLLLCTITFLVVVGQAIVTLILI